MIKFKCEFCDQRLGVPDDFIGKRVRCTKCRAVNIVPTAEERAARDAAKSAATLSSAPQASLPSEPPPMQKMALHSSLLDLSSGSGLLEAKVEGGESPGDSRFFGAAKAVPAFDPSSHPPMPVSAPAAAEEAKAGTAFGVQLEEEEGFPFDEASAGSEDSSAAKPGKKALKLGGEDDYGLGLLEDEPTDSSPGKVDLDGLGF